MKLLVKEFTGVKLSIRKKRNGELYIDFTPIINHANKLIKQKLKKLEKKKAFQAIITGSEFHARNR